jgi:uncharacterized membrane protein YcaP (DUF421 family)
MTSSYLYFLSLIASRTAIVFVAAVAGLRLLGKRQIGQVNIYDLAMIMALANAVQNAMTSGTGNLTTGIVCAGVLLVLGRLLSHLFVTWPRLEQNLCGTPTVLVSEGKIVHPHMTRAGVTEEQLNESLREHGFTDVSKARMAVLEVDGSLSIVPYVSHSAD